MGFLIDENKLQFDEKNNKDRFVRKMFENVYNKNQNNFNGQIISFQRKPVNTLNNAMVGEHIIFSFIFHK